jgi:hypothetical protein
VATETLMYGTRGVEEKTGVGEGVAEGVMDGVEVSSSGVAVNVGQGVGVAAVTEGITAAAVWVAPAIMVDIIAVPRKFRSWVGAGKLGTAHA